MNNDKKILAFDYVVSKLHEWYIESKGFDNGNDLSKLKITKLLFFTVAISSNRNDEGLLAIFDNFSALPFGHVESYVYDRMDTSDNYHIDKTQLVVKAGEGIQTIPIPQDLKTNIDSAVSKLKAANSYLINYKAFDLVDISHKWSSWKVMYELARKNNKYSISIPKELIMTELKTFVI